MCGNGDSLCRDTAACSPKKGVDNLWSLKKCERKSEELLCGKKFYPQTQLSATDGFSSL
jgi:hypothetical protein